MGNPLCPGAETLASDLDLAYEQAMHGNCTLQAPRLTCHDYNLVKYTYILPKAKLYCDFGVSRAKPT